MNDGTLGGFGCSIAATGVGVPPVHGVKHCARADDAVMRTARAAAAIADGMERRKWRVIVFMTGSSSSSNSAWFRVTEPSWPRTGSGPTGTHVQIGANAGRKLSSG